MCGWVGGWGGGRGVLTLTSAVDVKRGTCEHVQIPSYITMYLVTGNFRSVRG